MNYLKFTEDISSHTLLSKVSMKDEDEETTQENSANINFENEMEDDENAISPIYFPAKNLCNDNKNIYFNSQRSIFSKPDKFDILNEIDEENNSDFEEKNFLSNKKLINELLSKREQNLVQKSSNVSRKKIEFYSKSKSIREFNNGTYTQNELTLCKISEQDLNESLKSVKECIFDSNCINRLNQEELKNIKSDSPEFLTFGSPMFFKCQKENCFKCKNLKIKLIEDLQNEFNESGISKNDLIKIISKYLPN